jgi:hypothetical protein
VFLALRLKARVQEQIAFCFRCFAEAFLHVALEKHIAARVVFVNQSRGFLKCILRIEYEGEGGYIQAY